MHDKKSCGRVQPNASRTMLVYCFRTDTPGRASFSSLSSDASASTFAGRRDAVYGARRSVSGSSRKACEWCVTLLDLCLFGLQLKHSRRCEWTCTRILFGAFISCLRVGCSSNTIARCQWSSCPCSIEIQPFEVVGSYCIIYCIHFFFAVSVSDGESVWRAKSCWWFTKARSCYIGICWLFDSSREGLAHSERLDLCCSSGYQTI